MNISENTASKQLAVFEGTGHALLFKRLELLKAMSASSALYRKRAKVLARETLQRYTKLAADLGLKQVKDSLEDISFQLLSPEERNSIIDKVTVLFHLSGQDTLRLILENLRKTLNSNGLADFEIIGREKTPFSIWQKMKRKSLEVDQVRDIFGFRVIVPSISDCYLTLNILHDIFHAEYESFKDYIAFPKDQGYQSLHTTIIGPHQKRIEVQVRTVQMDAYIQTIYKEYWSQKSSFL